MCVRPREVRIGGPLPFCKLPARLFSSSISDSSSLLPCARNCDGSSSMTFSSSYGAKKITVNHQEMEKKTSTHFIVCRWLRFNETCIDLLVFRLLLFDQLLQFLSLQLSLCLLEFLLCILDGGFELVPMPVELCFEQRLTRRRLAVA